MAEVSISAVRENFSVPSLGSPMYAAVIGAEDLEASMAFYIDVMGFNVVERRSMEGRAFAAHWGLANGSAARCAVLADRGLEVGRIVLIQFEGGARERVRTIEGQRFFGLVNLNFYTEEIEPHAARLEAAGCRAWSRPVVHYMGPMMGQPKEVMLDGPDGVIINLIELRAENPEAMVLRTRAYVDHMGGYNRCGATPVATSQHCVKDREKAITFNQTVMDMSVRSDVILEGGEMEAFMGYPKGAKSRDTYLQGASGYGKIAVNHPLNFSCVDLTDRAAPPNIGYLAQSFIVPDLGEALARAGACGGSLFSPACELDLPALGRTAAAVVRNPGSGALHELLARL